MARTVRRAGDAALPARWPPTRPGPTACIVQGIASGAPPAMLAGAGLALGYFRDALAMHEDLLGPGHPHLTVARSALSDLLQTRATITDASIRLRQKASPRCITAVVKNQALQARAVPLPNWPPGADAFALLLIHPSPMPLLPPSSRSTGAIPDHSPASAPPASATLASAIFSQPGLPTPDAHIRLPCATPCIQIHTGPLDLPPHRKLLIRPSRC